MRTYWPFWYFWLFWPFQPFWLFRPDWFFGNFSKLDKVLQERGPLSIFVNSIGQHWVQNAHNWGGGFAFHILKKLAEINKLVGKDRLDLRHPIFVKMSLRIINRFFQNKHFFFTIISYSSNVQNSLICGQTNHLKRAEDISRKKKHLIRILLQVWPLQRFWVESTSFEKTQSLSKQDPKIERLEKKYYLSPGNLGTLGNLDKVCNRNMGNLRNLGNLCNLGKLGNFGNFGKFATFGDYCKFGIFGYFRQYVYFDPFSQFDLFGDLGHFDQSGLLTIFAFISVLAIGAILAPLTNFSLSAILAVLTNLASLSQFNHFGQSEHTSHFALFGPLSQLNHFSNFDQIGFLGILASLAILAIWTNWFHKRGPISFLRELNRPTLSKNCSHLRGRLCLPNSKDYGAKYQTGTLSPACFSHFFKEFLKKMNSFFSRKKLSLYHSFSSQHSKLFNLRLKNLHEKAEEIFRK